MTLLVSLDDPGLDSPDLSSHGSGPGIHVLERCPLNEVRLGRERTGGVAAIRGSAGLRQDEARLALACWHLALAWLHLGGRELTGRAG